MHGDISVIFDDVSCHIFIRGFQWSNEFLNIFDEVVIHNFLEYDAVTPSRLKKSCLECGNLQSAQNKI